MLRVIEDEQTIKTLQKEFEKQFRKFTNERIPVKIGYPGGNFDGTVSWANELGIWVYHEVDKDRCWNIFGLGRPEKHSTVAITCEINFPLQGIDRRIGGIFAKDNGEMPIVAHRGKIGGGRKGIGKSLFENNYIGDWKTVWDGRKQSKLALVGALNSSHFCAQVGLFIHEVDRLKRLTPSGTPPNSASSISHVFSKEFSGKKTYTVGQEVESQCDHGLIVNELASLLSKCRLKFGNDKNRDLYVIDRSGKIYTLFEVKTEINSTNLYTGIGQLLLNSVDMKNRSKLILVVPDGLEPALKKKLKALGIDSLVFRWKGNKAIFPGFNTLRL